MSEYKITREYIQSWLYTYQSGEKIFETYYRERGKLIQMKDLYDNEKEDLSMPIKDSKVYIYTDLKCMNANFQNLRESRKFYEEDYFSPFWDVSLHRHPRFYPEYLHDHSFFEICYVLSGECLHSVEFEEKTEKYCLKSGDLLILPPGLRHKVRMDTDSVAVNILIRRSTFEETFMYSIPLDSLLYQYFAEVIYADNAQECLVFHTKDDEEIPRLFYDMAFEYCNMKESASRIVNLLLSVFLAKILDNHFESIEILGKIYDIQDKIPAVLQYMNQNYAHMTMDDVAGYFHFSTSYLRKVFKESTGQTLIFALQQIRISRAKELLEKTNISVQKISYLVGYEDQTYFIRLFKKDTGLTPAKYRKEKNGKADGKTDAFGHHLV